MNIHSGVPRRPSRTPHIFLIVLKFTNLTCQVVELFTISFIYLPIYTSKLRTIENTKLSLWDLPKMPFMIFRPSAMNWLKNSKVKKKIRWKTCFIKNVWEPFEKLWEKILAAVWWTKPFLTRTCRLLNVKINSRGNPCRVPDQITTSHQPRRRRQEG